jgi:hypothetical protein
VAGGSAPGITAVSTIHEVGAVWDSAELALAQISAIPTPVKIVTRRINGPQVR